MHTQYIIGTPSRTICTVSTVPHLCHYLSKQGKVTQIIPHNLELWHLFQSRWRVRDMQISAVEKGLELKHLGALCQGLIFSKETSGKGLTSVSHGFNKALPTLCVGSFFASVHLLLFISAPLPPSVAWSQTTEQIYRKWRAASGGQTHEPLPDCLPIILYGWSSGGAFITLNYMLRLLPLPLACSGRPWTYRLIILPRRSVMQRAPDIWCNICLQHDCTVNLWTSRPRIQTMWCMWHMTAITGLFVECYNGLHIGAVSMSCRFAPYTL